MMFWKLVLVRSLLHATLEDIGNYPQEAPLFFLSFLLWELHSRLSQREVLSVVFSEHLLAFLKCSQ